MIYGKINRRINKITNYLNHSTLSENFMLKFDLFKKVDVVMYKELLAEFFNWVDNEKKRREEMMKAEAERQAKMKEEEGKRKAEKGKVDLVEILRDVYSNPDFGIMRHLFDEEKRQAKIKAEAERQAKMKEEEKQFLNAVLIRIEPLYKKSKEIDPRMDEIYTLFLLEKANKEHQAQAEESPEPILDMDNDFSCCIC